MLSVESPQLTWHNLLGAEKQKPYFQNILAFLKKEQAAGKKIYPSDTDRFNAFKLTSFEAVRVVILGQDPYHGKGQAHGLCFSVRHGVQLPPSLRNIFREAHDDVGMHIPSHGCLDAWAKQGVLLLNTLLSVEEGKPQSHANKGWEIFTDAVMQGLNDYKEGLIFLLWGTPAQRKGDSIQPSRHTILKTTHPSPLSAHRGFLGCRHFSQTNTLLRRMGKPEIDWQL